jgi:xanthine dehydrogenase large subunit
MCATTWPPSWRLDGCGAGAIRFAGGQVISPKTVRSFDDVVQAAYANRIQLWSDGFYRTPKIHYDKTTLTGRPFYYFAYGAACTEVVIDTLTGESRVLKVDILHDVGTASTRPSTSARSKAASCRAWAG